jgi:hypothetical protein
MLSIRELMMSLIDDAVATVAQGLHVRAGPDMDFRFVPKELAEKCRRLIESYHAMHGYSCLPDMLWRSDTRDFIERHRDFSHVFKSASKTRCAKRANDGFVLIATIILSLEVLGRDFSGWGKRFPIAKRKAENLIIEFLPRPRVWLIDMYLYPRRHIHPAFIDALAPPEEPKQATTAKEE